MFTRLRSKYFTRKTVAAFGALTFCGAGGVALTSLSASPVHADGVTLHTAEYPWSHNGIGKSLDHGSIRRGYQVYKQVCAACHSMEYVYFRRFVDVFMTEEEAKAEAAEIEVQDAEPDEFGKYFNRPGKLTDCMKDPYANKAEAKAANNGAYPPDLSLIVPGREGGEDYIFSLLTSYMDPPAGVELEDGQAFNPYFPGGKLAMAQQLWNEGIEYEDGTPASVSQQAKDVIVFLRWASEPYHDERKRLFIKVMMLMTFFTVVIWYYNRLIWAPLKYRQIVFKPRRKPTK